MRRYAPFPDLPESERAIGRRVRAVRKQHRLSRPSLGYAIELTQDQVKNVELGRAALRFAPGWRLCDEFDLNPLWLAFEEGQPHVFWDFVWTDEIDDDALFSHIVERFEQGDASGRGKYSERREEALRAEPIEQAAQHKSTFETLSRRIKPSARKEFWQRMERAAAGFIIDERQEMKFAIEFELDRVPVIQNTWILKVNSRRSHWDNLRRCVLARTVERGARADLARLLKVSPQVLNEWLQGRSAPPAEKTLRLLGWVEQGRIQQGNAGGAETPPALKTRKSKSTSHEKAKSD